MNLKLLSQLFEIIQTNSEFSTIREIIDDIMENKIKQIGPLDKCCEVEMRKLKNSM